MFKNLSIKNLDLSEIWASAHAWVQKELWDNGALIELVIVGVSALIGAFIYTFIRRQPSKQH